MDESFSTTSINLAVYFLQYKSHLVFQNESNSILFFIQGPANFIACGASFASCLVL